MSVTDEKKLHWFKNAYKNNRPLVYNVIGLSFLLSLFALGPPIFILFVYNVIIRAASPHILVQFLIGVAILIIGYYFLSKLRSQQLSIIGCKMEKFIGIDIFDQYIYLPPRRTSSASIGSQVSRLRDFAKIRELLTGPLAIVFFEFPFIIVGIIIIAALGGIIALIPLFALLAYSLLGIIFYKITKKQSKKNSEKNSQQQEFLIESMNKLITLKLIGAVKIWQNRYSDIASETSYANFKNTFLTGINNAISDSITIGTGLLIIGFCAVKIIAGELTGGAMLAIMILGWRILTPAKTLFNSYSRLLQTNSSFHNITDFMKLTSEAKASETITEPPIFHGDISFNHVSFRYPETKHPALQGIHFKIQPGKWIGIAGRNGSGKSTILKMILGIYEPQNGSVLIDKKDVEQFNYVALRKAIGYCPQATELLKGTIAENLRLGNPEATDQMLVDMTKKLAIYDTINKLPDKFNTKIESVSQLSSSFQKLLCIARTLLKDSTILLLDEPENMLDKKSNQALMNTLNEYQHKKTIMMVTNNQSNLAKMNLMMVLDKGQIIFAGKPNDILKKISEGLS